LVVRSIYRRKYEMAGYQVETAEEGAAALNLLPTFKPDLIQVDIMMPGMDGVEVIRQIRAWPEFHATPIWLCPVFYRPDLAKEAWKAGASKCVSKMDCTPNLALELVEQLLSGDETGFTRKFGTISLPKGALDAMPPSKSKNRPPPGRRGPHLRMHPHSGRRVAPPPRRPSSSSIWICRPRKEPHQHARLSPWTRKASLLPKQPNQPFSARPRRLRSSRPRAQPLPVRPRAQWSNPRRRWRRRRRAHRRKAPQAERPPTPGRSFASKSARNSSSDRRKSRRNCANASARSSRARARPINCIF